MNPFGGILSSIGANGSSIGANGQLLTIPKVQYGAVFPEVLLVCAALLLLLISSLFREKASSRVYAFYTTVVGIGCIASAHWLWHDISGGPRKAFDGAIAFDHFSLFFVVTIGLAIVLGALAGEDWLRRNGLDGPEYYVLLMLSGAGGMMMAAANDLIVVFLGLEILSIALYVLAGFNRRSEESREAAVKYFVLGAFSSAIFLYGIALVYGAVGTTNLSGIAAFLSTNSLIDSGLLLAGMALLVVGFAFKVAAVPFHQWTPDVYQGSPSPVTGFMAAAAKAAGFAALLRVFASTFFTQQLDWKPIILTLALLSLLVGSVVACVQQNVKRMLAYSSISHAGYILLGLAAANRDGVGGALYYLLTYTFIVIGTFAVVTVVGGQSDARKGIEAFRGIGRTNPALGFAFTVLLLAQAGVPLTSGFLAKFYVISAQVQNGSYGTAVFAMLIASVAAFFYLRLIIVMYGATDESERVAEDVLLQPDGSIAVRVVAVPASIVVVLFITVAFTIGLGVLPPQVIDAIEFARRSAADLFSGS